MIKANYESIVISKEVRVNKLSGGSTNIEISEYGLPCIKSYQNKPHNKNIGKIRCICLVDIGDYLKGEIMYLDKEDFEDFKLKGWVDRVKLEYKLNKSKVRSKIMAYSRLKVSRRFMAFYSISFPKGLEDNFARTIHNTVLTRLRKIRPEFTYIWIAERQKNGTIHFHMLTNNYFNIRIINKYYAKAIQNIIVKNNLSQIKYDVSKYNGVDVKLVKSIDGLSKYLTKYLTKNDEKFNGLVWNCDSSVSSLVTHLYLSDDNFKEIEKKAIYSSSFEKFTAHHPDPMIFDVYVYGSSKPKLIYLTLDDINHYILKNFTTKFRY